MRFACSRQAATSPTDIKLQQAEATFSQDNYNIKTAIDGNSTAIELNGWAIAPQFGRDHSAKFELAKPLERRERQPA